jgi:hypothetical protein
MIDKELFVECLNKHRFNRGLRKLDFNDIHHISIYKKLIIYSTDTNWIGQFQFDFDLYIQYIRNKKIDSIIEI